MEILISRLRTLPQNVNNENFLTTSFFFFLLLLQTLV